MYRFGFKDIPKKECRSAGKGQSYLLVYISKRTMESIR